MIADVTSSARRTVGNADGGSVTPMIVASLRLLFRERESFDEDLNLVTKFLSARMNADLQTAVVDRLAALADPAVADRLVDEWSGYGPGMRAHVLEVMANRTAWNRRLLQAVNAGQVSLSAIAPALRERLLASNDPQLKQQWSAALQTKTSEDRSAVFSEYEAALQLTGDVGRGGQLFLKHCASCHKLGDVGFEVGPNLASITDKRAIALLTAIIDPNAAVEARYVNYVVLMVDGRTVSGLLDTETGTSITLKMPDGKVETVLRSEIEELRGSAKSLMPEGIEKVMTQQDVADVIRFVSEKIRAD